MKWVVGIVVFIIVVNIFDSILYRTEQLEKRVKNLEAFVDSTIKDDLK